jgi:hypothetical protein
MTGFAQTVTRRYATSGFLASLRRSSSAIAVRICDLLWRLVDERQYSGTLVDELEALAPDQRTAAALSWHARGGRVV